MTEYTKDDFLKLYDYVFSELNENFYTNEKYYLELARLHELAAKLSKNLNEIERTLND